MRRFEPVEIEGAAEILREGGLGVVPTDTVYGIAALASDEGAVSRLLDLKERPPEKPLPVQVSSTAEANLLAWADTPTVSLLASNFWPGPLTIVMRRRAVVGLPFQRGETIGIRIPDNRFCLSLIKAAGFLVVPSANPPGEDPPTSLGRVSPSILKEVEFVVEGGPCRLGVESTVVDVSKVDLGTGPGSPRRRIGELRVLREGAVTTRQLLAVLKKAGGD